MFVRYEKYQLKMQESKLQKQYRNQFMDQRNEIFLIGPFSFTSHDYSFSP